MEAAPKEFVSMTSQPDSRNWRWTSFTASGRVMTRFSLQPSSNAPPKSSALRSCFCRDVPVAPSKTRTGRSDEWRRAKKADSGLVISNGPAVILSLML